jgi:drug/metabolite transporter (DMT)-like permease
MANYFSLQSARDRAAGQSAFARSRLAGIALICAATTLFAFLDTSVKYLGTVAVIPILQIIWIRFITNIAFVVALMGPGKSLASLKSKKIGLQLLRSTFLLLTTACNFAALQYLQLDQTSTILFLSPFIVAALAGPLLGEWVGWRRLAAICVGFSGVIFVTRPGFGGIHWAISFSFVAAFCYALYSLVTRYLARFDTSSTTAIYTPIVGGLVFAPFALISWKTPESAGTLLLLLATGILGGFSHWLLILAHERAPAPVLAPFGYFNIVAFISLGYLVFGDVPRWWTLAGASIIVASGIYLISRERYTSGDGPASAATVVEG